MAKAIRVKQWTCLLKFGDGLYIYAKGKHRMGVNKNGKPIAAYYADREGPTKHNIAVESA